jgi:type IV secretion system protein VirB8
VSRDDPETDAYFAQAGSWADDRLVAIQSSRRVAWVVAITATALALLLGIVIFAILPLRTVVPYTLLVDKQTGFVQKLDPMEASRIAPDTALTQSFLVQYVIARENFDRATVLDDYRRVTLWSADAAKSDYVSAIQVSNPASPLARLPRDAVIDVRVRSVSSLANSTALVRFETIRRDRGGSGQPVQGWVAVVTYRYSDILMSVEDRYLNPLGFQVMRYRRNAESPPVAAAAPLTPPLPVSLPAAAVPSPLAVSK